MGTGRFVAAKLLEVRRSPELSHASGASRAWLPAHLDGFATTRGVTLRRPETSLSGVQLFIRRFGGKSFASVAQRYQQAAVAAGPADKDTSVAMIVIEQLANVKVSKA